VQRACGAELRSVLCTGQGQCESCEDPIPYALRATRVARCWTVSSKKKKKKAGICSPQAVVLVLGLQVCKSAPSHFSPKLKAPLAERPECCKSY
jgi:hypothetical protein